jgi:hypothetical protein
MPGHDQEDPGGDISPPLRAEAGKKKQHKPDTEETLKGVQAPVLEGPDQSATYRQACYSR